MNPPGSPVTLPAAPLAVSLPPAERAELDRLARIVARDPAVLVAEAVTAYLDVHRLQSARIEEGLRQAEAGQFASDAEVDAAFAKFG